MKYDDEFDDRPDEERKGSPLYWLALAAFAILFTLVIAFFPTLLAHAEEVDTNPIPNHEQQEIEKTAAAYDKAQAALESANADVKENKKYIDQLEREIPKQKERSAKAARDQYKLSQQTGGLVEFLISANNFYDFLASIDYISRVTDANVSEMKRLNDLKCELDKREADLEKVQAQAQENAQAAEEALHAAQEARHVAQVNAQEECRRQSAQAIAEAEAARERAAAAARAKAKAQAEAKSKAGSSGAASSKDGSSPDAGSAGASAKTSGSAAQSDGVAATTGKYSLEAPIDDGADWFCDKETFVKEWSARIDAYLAGSPLEGQGDTFASAAWIYGVDPRWSPAISCTESSRGAICFLPHNAWGWGQVSWSSWEEAIYAHVAGLARGYGYTISVQAAKTYCPPNWEYWFSNTSSQMNSI